MDPWWKKPSSVPIPLRPLGAWNGCRVPWTPMAAQRRPRSASARPRRRQRWNTRVPRNPNRAPLGGCRVSLGHGELMGEDANGAGSIWNLYLPKKIGAWVIGMNVHDCFFFFEPGEKGRYTPCEICSDSLSSGWASGRLGWSLQPIREANK